MCSENLSYISNVSLHHETSLCCNVYRATNSISEWERNGLRPAQRQCWHRGRCCGDTDGRFGTGDWNGYREAVMAVWEGRRAPSLALIEARRGWSILVCFASNARLLRVRRVSLQNKILIFFIDCIFPLFGCLCKCTLWWLNRLHHYQLSFWAEDAL